MEEENNKCIQQIDEVSGENIEEISKEIEENDLDSSQDLKQRQLALIRLHT